MEAQRVQRVEMGTETARARLRGIGRPNSRARCRLSHGSPLKAQQLNRILYLRYLF